MSPSERDDRSIRLIVLAMILVPLTLIMLIPSAVGIYLVQRESQHRDQQAAEQRELLRRAFVISNINQCNRDANQNAKLRDAALQLGLQREDLKLLPGVPAGGRRDDGTWIGCGNYPPPLP